MAGERITVKTFRERKRSGEPITSLTAYDAIMAEHLDKAGVDLILVGDSLGNVVQGKPTTVPVTLEEMIYHGEIVTRNVKHGFVAVDMPFMTYKVSIEKSLEHAGMIMQQTGCQGVKLEGGVEIAETVSRIVSAGIPVLGHVGMTPQSVNAFGGFGVQGRENERQVLDGAKAVAEAGAFAIVLEKIPSGLAERITAELPIPTIGIGAGPACDGQVLVIYDILGMIPDFNPKFVRKYADLSSVITSAVQQYCKDVKSKTFPSSDESYD